MGGNIVVQGDEIFRVGQNNCFGYGDSITICRIIELSRVDYRETPVAFVKTQSPMKGPHTLNFHGDRIVFDFNVDKFSLVSGLRRIRYLLAKKH